MSVFDPTITTGNVIQIMMIAAGGLWFIWEMRTRMAILLNNYDMLTQRLSKIGNELEQLAKLAVEIARQDERMAAQDVRIQELSNRLDGYISLSKRSGNRSLKR